MKKIAVVTATRAEYGLLSPVIRELRKKENEELKIHLIVTGTHLSEQYGMTINEIEERIDYRILISVKSDTEEDISTNQAEALIKFTKFFKREKYNAVIILGDRYEMLAIAIAAGNTRTPIFHLCGGDTTEGAIDEWIRHSITKMSYLHFVTNEESRSRVIQMGEDPSRVYNYGSTSIDNILSVATLSKKDALDSIGLSDCRYALCTYHPVTIVSENIEDKITAFLEAIKEFPDIQFIVTKSNADQGGSKINDLLDVAEKNIDNMHVYTSLGIHRYLSLMKYSEFVLGNSSSGVIETPAFHIPTVNIGDRQRGRLQAQSIINCGDTKECIVEGIKQALSPSFIELCKNTRGKYGEGNSAPQIASKVIETVMNDDIDLRKRFTSFCGRNY